MKKTYLVIILVCLLFINAPVLSFLNSSADNGCVCADNWKRRYLKYYLSFWFGISALEIILIIGYPKTVIFIITHKYYFYMSLLTLIGFTYYIIFLWSYIEHLKIEKCDCSNIKNERYVSYYSVIIFNILILGLSVASMLYLSKIRKTRRLKKINRT